MFLLLLACTPETEPPKPDTEAPEDTATDSVPCTDEWFADADGDGYGGASLGTACEAPEGAVATADDCDDASATTHPGATDVCDGVDNDCDPATAESGVTVDGVATDGSIGDALAAAAEGATISVCAGRYTESLVIERSVTLRAPDGASATVLEGAGGPVISVLSGEVTLDGLTITGGTAGGVEASAAAALVLNACVVTDNVGVSGAGVYGPAAGPLTITGGSYTGNEAEEYGGAIYAAELTIDGALLEGNTAFDGGGIFLVDGGTATLTATSVSSNEAENIGGAAYVGIGATVDATGMTWMGDRAAVYAAGMYLDEGATLTDTGGAWDNLASEDKGGAIYARYATVHLTDGTFTGNSGSWGGHVFLYGSTLSAANTTFRYGLAELASAVYVYMESAATLTDCAVEGNTSGSGGAVRLRTTSSLVSERTSWGVDATDNIPTDVDVSNAAMFAYTDAASFTCSTDSVTCE